MNEPARWLLRHGETTGGQGFRGRTDDPLTGAGLVAMRDAVNDLDPPAIVVTSPSIRCRAFAETYADHHHVPLVVEDDLREMDFGQWEGLTASDILRRDPHTLEAFWRDPHSATPPGGERFAEFVERVTGAWSRVDRRAEARVLAVAHAGPIRLVLLCARNLPMSFLMDLDVPYASLHRVPRTATGD